MQPFMDDPFLRGIMVLDDQIDQLEDLGDLEFRIEGLESEIQRLESQMSEEEREYTIQQKFLAEIAKERANLGRNYRVNWLKEGF